MIDKEFTASLSVISLEFTNPLSKYSIRKFNNICMNQIISCEIGKRIRTIRLSKGKTMINLAHDSDMEYIQLSRIERGQINTTIFQLYKIAQALEVDLQFLFENFETEINDKLNFENLLDSSSKK
jgi:ribosome-binding protein aMBF1 (putative translation factor)